MVVDARVAEVGEGQGERDTEVREGSDLPAAGTGLFEEVENDGGCIEGTGRRGAVGGDARFWELPVPDGGRLRPAPPLTEWPG